MTVAVFGLWGLIRRYLGSSDCRETGRDDLNGPYNPLHETVATQLHLRFGSSSAREIIWEPGPEIIICECRKWWHRQKIYEADLLPVPAFKDQKESRTSLKWSWVYTVIPRQSSEGVGTSDHAWSPKIPATHGNEEELEKGRKAWVAVGIFYETKILGVTAINTNLLKISLGNEILFSIPQWLELGTDFSSQREEQIIGKMSD